MIKRRPEPTQFGRLYAPDPRDMGHIMRTNRAHALSVASKFHNPGPVRNQGNEPSCVGYAGQHFLEAAPIMRRMGRVIPAGSLLYKEAQRRDEWPGEAYEGTSARGLMRYLKEIGIISEYVWADRIETLRDFILTRGPVLVGSEWYAGMQYPKFRETGRHDGYYMEPTGEWYGGHEVMYYGYSRWRHAFRIQNSHGVTYAENGRAWIDYDVANHVIFGMNGDAVSAMEVA